jgi:hypothetical protein
MGEGRERGEDRQRGGGKTATNKVNPAHKLKFPRIIDWHQLLAKQTGIPTLYRSRLVWDERLVRLRFHLFTISKLCLE